MRVVFTAKARTGRAIEAFEVVLFQQDRIGRAVKNELVILAVVFAGNLFLFGYFDNVFGVPWQVEFDLAIGIGRDFFRPQVLDKHIDFFFFEHRAFIQNLERDFAVFERLLFGHIDKGNAFGVDRCRFRWRSAHFDLGQAVVMRFKDPEVVLRVIDHVNFVVVDHDGVSPVCFGHERRGIEQIAGFGFELGFFTVWRDGPERKVLDFVERFLADFFGYAIGVFAKENPNLVFLVGFSDRIGFDPQKVRKSPRMHREQRQS